MYRHLVAVEVRVERRAHQRVNLNGFPLDQDRLESLYAETVKGRGTVKEHGVLLDHILQYVPHLRPPALDHLLGAPYVRCQSPIDEHLHDERLKEFDRHEAWQTALMHLEARADHDHRTARVIYALAQKVLPEAALLALEHVREALQRSVSGAGYCPTPSAIVEESIHGLLKHPLLVIHDHVRSPELEQSAEPVVAVDNPTIQVARSEAPAVELDHWPEVRRQNWYGLHNHPLRPVVARAEGIHPLQALYSFLALLTLRLVDRVTEVLGLGLQVYLAYEIPYRLGAHTAAEVHTVAVLIPEAVLHLAEELLVIHDLPGLQGLELLPRLPDALYLLVHAPLDIRNRLLGLLVDLLDGRLAVLLGDLGVLFGELVRAALVPYYALTLGAQRLGLQDLLVPLLFELPDLLLYLLAQRAYVVCPPLPIYPSNNGACEVQDPIELLRANVQKVTHPAWHALHEPHVRDRGG